MPKLPLFKLLPILLLAGCATNATLPVPVQIQCPPPPPAPSALTSFVSAGANLNVDMENYLADFETGLGALLTKAQRQP